MADEREIERAENLGVRFPFEQEAKTRIQQFARTEFSLPESPNVCRFNADTMLRRAFGGHRDQPLFA